MNLKDNDYRGGCSNRQCVCWTIPTTPCPKFIYYFTFHCARCGWTRHKHNRPPLIHNGGKR